MESREWTGERLKCEFKNKEVRKLLPEATRAIQIVLISPATNAVSERSFSKLKLLKTHLRSTCGDERLASLMVCAIHKDTVMNIVIDLANLANSFVGNVSNRISTFGKFNKNEIL